MSDTFKVVITLSTFASMLDAANAADQIRDAGNVTINTVEGDVNFTVGDVTVES